MKFLNLFRHSGSEKKDHPMILVTGNPKTGTTAVYHSIRSALPGNSICLFEPENRKQRLPDVISTPVLVKSFIPYSEAFDYFDKKILIIRDPRDQIISQMLYRPYNIISKGFIASGEKLEQVLEEIIILLHRKEQDPDSVTVQEIRKLLNMGPVNEYIDKLIDYYQKRPDVFIYKYEDFIDGHLKHLSKYLGQMLKKIGDVPEKRVIRSKSYGNWKDWFTPSDVEFFRPLVNEYMQMFGYHDTWELNSHPFIDPSLSSQFVMKLIDEAKEFRKMKKQREADSHNQNPE